MVTPVSVKKNHSQPLLRYHGYQGFSIFQKIIHILSGPWLLAWDEILVTFWLAKFFHSIADGNILSLDFKITFINPAFQIEDFF